MDSILPDAAPGHHNEIPGFRPLQMGRLAQDLPGHDSSCSAIDQGFSQIAVVKDQSSVEGGDPALVSTMLDPFSYPFVDALRMKQARGKGFVIKGGGEAEEVDVEDQLGALSRAKRVAVDPNDAGQGSAVGVQSARRIVGLHLKYEIIAIIEPN